MKTKDIPEQNPEEIVVAQALSQLREERNSPKGRSGSTSPINSSVSPTGSSSSQNSAEQNHCTLSGAPINPSSSHANKGHSTNTTSIAPGEQPVQSNGTLNGDEKKHSSKSSTESASASVAGSRAESRVGSTAGSTTSSRTGSKAASVERENSAETSSAPAAATGDQPPEKQWRNMLLTATSLVLTKQTRRKFRKLLSVLKLASEHLNTKVVALRETMEVEASQDNKTPKLSSVAIRNDIILTIKKCVAVLSTLATSSLPAAASEKVRNHILCLPEQWANQLGESSRNAGIDGKSESAVLALASETLISIRKITNVLTETLERADSWVEKLPTFIGKRVRDSDESENVDLEGVNQEPSNEPSNDVNGKDFADATNEKHQDIPKQDSSQRPHKSLKRE